MTTTNANVNICENFNIINNYINNNNLEPAVEQINKWLAQEPNNPMPYTFLAHIYSKYNDLDKALSACAQALNIKPDFYSAMVEKARILVLQNKHILACHVYIQIYQHYPLVTEYLYEWCRSLLEIQDYNTLLQIANLSLQTQPNNADLYFYAALALQYQNKFEEAIPLYERAYELEPNMPMLLNNLGASYKETNQLNKAKELFEKEITENSKNPMAWTNYGSVLQKMDMLNQAYKAHINSIKLSPQYSISYNNLGLLLKEMADIKGAEQALEAAVKFDPNYESAKWNLAMVKLVQGNYEEGWKLHEHRWNGSSELKSRHHGLIKPEWAGTQNIKGKKIFLWGEQGFGDALQFCRYIPLFAEKINQLGGEVIYCCFTALQDLFISSFSDLFNCPIIDDKQRPLPEFDYHVPLLKLPMLFNTTIETIPDTSAYIQPSKQAILKYRDIFKNDNKLKVGLIWTGNPTHQRNPYRSVGLNNYVRFKDIQGISFYSLQFNSDKEIKEANQQGLQLTDLTKNIDNFDESAAIIKQLDLVITTCTSTAHLAGALGIKTWVLLDVNPHWVWLMDRTDSPWYPKTKLYRQTEYKNWEPVLEKIRIDLTAWANAHQQNSKKEKSEKNNINNRK